MISFSDITHKVKDIKNYISSRHKLLKEIYLKFKASDTMVSMVPLVGIPIPVNGRLYNYPIEMWQMTAFDGNREELQVICDLSPYREWEKIRMQYNKESESSLVPFPSARKTKPEEGQ